MAQTKSEPGLAGVIAAANAAQGDQPAARGLPPVHLWNPPNCGEIDIRIAKDGAWFHEGSRIGREALVRLFSTILRKEPDGVYLVTPAEKLKITVEDAPFVAVRVDQTRGEGGAPVLRFLTNVGDEVEAGPEHPIRVAFRDGDEPRPYVHVRAGLEALIARPVFYELAELAQERDTPQGRDLGVASNGAWFSLGTVEAAS